MIRYELQSSGAQHSRRDTPFHRYVFDDGSVWTEFYRDDDGYLLRFPGLADFTVSNDGGEVSAWPAEGTDATTVEHLYINQVVPLALSRQGRPAFHASAVSVPGGAIAILGATGIGKSTLAASYALNGAAFLTDDALIIEETPHGCEVRPSHPSLRLWDDSIAALVGPGKLDRTMISYSSKSRCLAGDALMYNDEPQCLLAAFVLVAAGADDVVIKELIGIDRYMSWLRNSFLLDVVDQDMLARHFEWTHRISGGVTTLSLDYPRDYAMLPRVRQAIADHLANE